MFVKAAPALPARPTRVPPELAARVRPLAALADRVIPLPPPLAGLFPDLGLRRGTTVMVTGDPGHGAAALALGLLGGASLAGSWCAVVGLADPGVVAMAELGIDLQRLALVPTPGSRWAEATAHLLDGVDAVVVHLPGRVRPTPARHLVARARERRAALIVLADRAGHWPEVPDLLLRAGSSHWEGVGRGHGYLRGRRLEVQIGGRRAAPGRREQLLWLPGCDGQPAGAAPGGRVVEGA